MKPKCAVNHSFEKGAVDCTDTLFTYVQYIFKCEMAQEIDTSYTEHSTSQCTCTLSNAELERYVTS